ncbi:MAG: ISAs1 family transposase [Lutibacter sp.]|uniref:ISAs1 family transposase n=1 Tax=Lutibacter sp. TaxID=1925666 RepID=UPI00385B6EEF
MKSSDNLKDIFRQIEDHRSHINQLHNLVDILLIDIISVICGAETWEQMVGFAKSKEAFLRKFLELPSGIPSKDTLNRAFSAIDSEQFESCFVDWVNSIADISKGQIIAIDGKTIRGAKSYGKKSSIHMVSAWACENNLVLGQVKTAEKSNEITAIPELLDILNVSGNTITIDAMGTQKEIAKKIIDQDANYILAVKANQPEFRFYKPLEIYTNEDLGHGRIETRTCSVITDFQFIENENGWKNLASIIKLESTREFKNSDKATEKATRYYISSLQNDANQFQSKIRSHWAVENKLHWTLDVAFSEDASRKRAGNAAQNYSILLKIALNLLKNEASKKLSIKSKRLEAGWNDDYLLKILNLKV